MEIHIYEGKTRLDIWRVKDYHPIPNVGEYIHITNPATDKKVLQRVFGENIITLKVE